MPRPASLALGRTHVFDPTSFIISGGGSKGRTLPENSYEMVRDWTGVEWVEESYGMSELMGMNAKCSAGNYHVNPWLIPYVLDVDSLEPLPIGGTTTGRFAAIDLLASSYWSGYISTDLVTMTWDPMCSCERQGPYLDAERPAGRQCGGRQDLVRGDTPSPRRNDRVPPSAGRVT